MKELMNLMALAIVYFLIVYITIIRHRGQKALPWVFLILVQTISVSYFEVLSGYIGSIPFLSGQSIIVPNVVTVLVLLIINIGVILITNLLFFKKENKDVAEIDFSVDMEHIAPVREEKSSNNTSREINLEDGPILAVSSPVASQQENAKNTQVHDDMSEESIFQTIEELVEAGHTEDAIKYLRMVAFFGKTPDAIDKAKKLLADLQPQ